jgi:hypothetical protein
MNSQENKSNLWKAYGILMGLMLAGSALVLGGQAIWSKWQERSNSGLQDSKVTTLPSSSISESTTEPTEPTSQPTPVDTQVSVQTEQVSFDPGTSGATLRGSISRGQVRRYLLNCGSGQTMKVSLSQGSIRIVVKSPDNQVLGEMIESNNQWQGSLPMDGDYQVEVSSPNGAEYLMTIEVL